MKNWTIETLSQAIQYKEASIVDIAQEYVQEILESDPSGPNAVITLNPFWKEQALELQASLNDQSNPLHGIPILIKDNIDTIDMGNSAGSLALKDTQVEKNAPLITQLEAAGALILGKTNLSEWANFRSTASISGWSSLGGQTRNGINNDNSPSGSSSGSAAAVTANLSVAAIGTETDGSIVSPAAHNNIIGLKPTVGRVSRTGIIPIAWSQDTAGPMTKTVTDAALMLDVLVAPDSQDPVTMTQPPCNTVNKSFTTHCSSSFIKGKRIGVLPIDDQFPEELSTEYKLVTQRLENAGATCIKIAPVPAMVTLQDDEITQMTCEFPEALEKYIKERRPTSPYKNLKDFAQFNELNANTVMPLFKQEWFDKCLKTPPTNSNKYKSAQQAIELFRAELKSQWFEQHQLDAVVCATNGPPWELNAEKGDRYTGGNSHIAAVSGWPSITVPYNTNSDMPLGALFIALPWQEASLIGIAFGFEQNG